MESGRRHSWLGVPVNSFSIAVLVAIITLAALILRLLFIGEYSFWYDEILSVRRAQLDSDSFWALIRSLPPMALYYVLLHYWLELGNSDSFIRMLSVIPAVATIPVVYLLGSRLFGVRVGLIGAAILTLNAFHIQYSQEVRGYSLLVFFAALSSLFFVRGIQHSSWINWSGYVIATVLAFHSHYFAVFVPLAHAASLPFLPFQLIPWKKYLTSGVAITAAIFWPKGYSILLDLSQIPSKSFAPAVDVDDALNWRPEFVPFDAYRFAIDITGSGGNLLLLAYLVPLLIACAVAINLWFSLGRTHTVWKYAFLLSSFLLPIIICIAFSVLVTPAFISRYLIICLVPLVVLTSVGIIWITRAQLMRMPAIPLVVLALILALSVKGTYAYYTEYEKQDWRGAASLVASEWQTGDGMLFYVPWMDEVLDYYLHDAQGDSPDMRSVVSKNGWIELTDPSVSLPTRETIAEYIPNGYDRIWLVLGHTTPPWRQSTSHEIQAALRERYSYSIPLDFSGIQLVLYSQQEVLSLSGYDYHAGCVSPGRDFSGHNNHGILIHGPIHREGQFEGALEFDGRRSHVLVGDVHGFEGNAPFTVSLWANDKGGSETYGRLLSKEQLANGREGWLVFNYRNGSRYGFERWTEGRSDNINFEYPRGQWNHIAFTYDGTNMTAYLNGVRKAGPVESSIAIQPTFSSLVIGGRSDTKADFYQGTLDEIRIYNRALDSNEISDLAQPIDVPQLSDEGLVSDWKFDEATGNALAGCAIVEEPIDAEPTEPSTSPPPATRATPTVAPNSGSGDVPTATPEAAPTQPSPVQPTPAPFTIPTPLAIPTPTTSPSPVITPTQTSTPPNPSLLRDGEGHLHNPGGVAIDAANRRVFVADSENHRVQVFTTDGRFLLQWGEGGSDPGQFNSPQGIAVNSGSSIVYVADTGNHRVQAFNTSGRFLFQWGEHGSSEGQFEDILDLAVNPRNGNVYLVDSGNHRVQVFNSSGSLLLSEWGGQGRGDGQFNSPSGIAVDPDSGKVYVADTGNNRVKVHYESGVLDATWGARGSGQGQLQSPTDVAFHPSNGYLYIADSGNHRVLVLDGIWGAHMFEWGQYGSHDGQFADLRSIAIDPQSGEVYIVDASNHRVQAFNVGGTFRLDWGSGAES